MIASLSEKQCKAASHFKALRAKSNNKIYSVRQELSECVGVRVLASGFSDNPDNLCKTIKEALTPQRMVW
jgi:hypothetical protein